MKSLLNIAITSTVLLLSANAFAAKAPSQNQLLTQCKTIAGEQFDNVKSVKLKNMKNTRGKFEAKFRVASKAERGMFLCTIQRDSAPQIVRLDQGTSTVAANK